MESEFGRLDSPLAQNSPPPAGFLSVRNRSGFVPFFLSAARAAVFPLWCAGCGVEEAILCNSCRSQAITRVSGLFSCPGCGRSVPGGSRCGRADCRRRTSLDGLFSAGLYADPVLRTLLQQYKYEGVLAAGEELGLIFRSCLERHVLVWRGQAATVTALPLHPIRQAWRGFNQAACFGRLAAGVLGLSFVGGLLKRRFRWRRQADLADAGERRGNASGSFAPTARLTAGSVGRGETIILVDDVYTSGATLNEAAKTLKNAGYAAVYGMTVLRG